MRCGFN